MINVEKIKLFLKQMWCGFTGHAGIHFTGGRHTEGFCKKCHKRIKFYL